MEENKINEVIEEKLILQTILAYTTDQVKCLSKWFNLAKKWDIDLLEFAKFRLYAMENSACMNKNNNDVMVESDHRSALVNISTIMTLVIITIFKYFKENYGDHSMYIKRIDALYKSLEVVAIAINSEDLNECKYNNVFDNFDLSPGSYPDGKDGVIRAMMEAINKEMNSNDKK